MNVFTTTPCVPCVNRTEALRYAGVREASVEIEALLDSCIAETENSFSYKVCYAEVEKDSLPKDLSSLSFLENCKKTIIFAATVGLEIDRLIKKYSVISPSRALMLQALGAERIEALCDAFCQGFPNAAQRYSPGYGNFTLENQSYIFSLLNPSRHIGLTLNTSLLMSPSKSVTAIFGLKE